MRAHTDEAVGRYVADGALAIVAGALVRGSVIASMVAIGRSTDHAQLGAYSLGYSVIATGSTLALLGMQTSITKLVPELVVRDRNRVGAAVAFSLLATALSSILLAVPLAVWTRPIAEWVYGDVSIVRCLRLSAIAVPLAAAGALGCGGLFGLGQVARASRISIGSAALSLVVTLLLVRRCGAEAGLLGLLCFHLSTSLCFWHAAGAAAARQGVPLFARFKRADMKLVPILALPSFVANGTTPLAFFMVNSSVAAALGLKALGLFAVALQMFQVTMFIPAAINGPTLGYLSARFSAGEQRTYSGAAMQSVRLLLAAVIPLVGLMLLLAPGLIRGLYGATYAEAAPASIVLLLASPAMLVSSGLSLAMIAAGRAWTACAAAVVWLLLVGSLVMLGARAGLLGVAAAIAVSCYCGAAATIYLARPLLRFDDLPSRRTVTLLALSLLVPAALGWTALGWTACVIVAVPLQGVVVLGLWTLMLTPEDKRALVALLVRAGLNLDRYGAERPANCSQTQVDLTIGPL